MHGQQNTCIKIPFKHPKDEQNVTIMAWCFSIWRWFIPFVCYRNYVL